MPRRNLGGRPSKFRTEYIEIAKRLRRQGFSNEILHEAFGEPDQT
jgi:hypothetical protein